MTTEPGLRERKKQERADAIVDAAQSLVLDRGLDAVTVEEIADVAGISARTFFNYFDTKDDAVLGQTALRLGEDFVLAFVEGGPTGSFWGDVERLVLELVGRVGDPGRVHRAFGLMHSEPRLLARHVVWIEGHRGRITELFAARAATAPLPAAADLCSLTTFTALRAAGERWESTGRSGSLADHLHDVVAELAALGRA
ncbi:TetR family transcriptional regulator [Isoptericola halotolerans]|uniref:AcrR family transcriptional regulator n=1 Tax=Isoptericola halotolerans TaxID=300560 RepID=A0ABX2A1Q8_9MICO|nr:AcrR family transcriptional regulator [Isoptericola halotolerans]